MTIHFDADNLSLLEERKFNKKTHRAGERARKKEIKTNPIAPKPEKTEIPKFTQYRQYHSETKY